jgi:hypothetical protein
VCPGRLLSSHSTGATGGRRPPPASHALTNGGPGGRPSARAAYAVERRPYENRYARFMKLHEGKVIDGTAFYDSISNDLWTRVEPRS